MSSKSNLAGAGRYFRHIQKYAVAHKFASAIIAVAILGGGWFTYQKITAVAAPAKYVLTTVRRGTIIASVTGSGQVSASDQVVINPKASGEVVAVYARDGQKVVAGQALASIDSSDAQKAVRDAKANLQSTQLALQKLQQPADTLSMTQAQNNLSNAQSDLQKIYQSSYNDVVATYLDLPTIMTSFQDIVGGTQAARGLQGNLDYYENQVEPRDLNAAAYHDTAVSDFKAAQTAYAAALADFKSTSQSSSTSTIRSTVKETYDTTKAVTDALKSTNVFIQFYSDVTTNYNGTVSSTATTALTNLNTYIGKMNAHLATLLSDTNAITADEQNVTEASQSLQKLQSGADPLDVQSSQLSVQQKQNALQDAEDALSHYTIRAPFYGTIANFNLNKGDTISTATAAATEISAGEIADLSLNEVDAAKIAVGEKATLTFDAIEGLTIAGEVASISPLGTVSQGVVSYEVKIAFDTQDPRVKPGMTVNAAIITGMKQNALIVPSSAVKSHDGSSYVLVVEEIPAGAATSTSGVQLASAPRQISVTAGISSDTETEITSGLRGGEVVVVRTAASTVPAAQAPSIFGGGVRTSGASGGARGAGGTSR